MSDKILVEMTETQWDLVREALKLAYARLGPGYEEARKSALQALKVHRLPLVGIWVKGGVASVRENITGAHYLVDADNLEDQKDVLEKAGNKFETLFPE